MMFLQAFLIGGLLCAVFQVALMFTKLGVPKLLIIGLALGGLCTPLGLCDVLANAGGAGFSVMVVGAAQAIFNSITALFHGVWLPVVVVVAIFAALTVFGLLAGAAYGALHQSELSTAQEGK